MYHTFQPDVNLVDFPERLGSVALHEVIMGGAPETARFLRYEHNANADVLDLGGYHASQYGQYAAPWE